MRFKRSVNVRNNRTATPFEIHIRWNPYWNVQQNKGTRMMPAAALVHCPSAHKKHLITYIVSNPPCRLRPLSPSDFQATFFSFLFISLLTEAHSSSSFSSFKNSKFQTTIISKAHFFVVIHRVIVVPFLLKIMLQKKGSRKEGTKEGNAKCVL